MPAPTIRAFAAQDTLDGSMDVTLPGCQVGDVLVVFVSEDYRPQNLSAPGTVAGVGAWTEATKTPSFTTGGCGVRTFYATVTSAGDKTITATTTVGDFGNLGAYCVAGADGTPWQGVNTSATYTQTPLTAALPASATADAVAVGIWVYFDQSPEGTAGVTMPPGWTEDDDHGNGGYGAMAYARYPLIPHGVALGPQQATLPNATGTRVSISTVLLAGTPDVPAPPSGSASGGYSFTGTASGASAPEGTVSGTFTWTADAEGRTDHDGAAVGALSWTSAATGARASSGTVSAALSWTGTASGTAPDVDSASGTAAGAYAWAGASSGVLAPAGSAAGTLSWSTTASGHADPCGAASGLYAWTGVASGYSEPGDDELTIGRGPYGSAWLASAPRAHPMAAAEPHGHTMTVSTPRR